MLGRLSKWLRVFGYDTAYAKENSRPGIILQSLRESRILITRDHNLSRKRAWKLVLIQSNKVEEQLRQVINETRINPSPDRLFRDARSATAKLRR